MYKLQYTKNAEEDLNRLERNLAKRIVKKIDFFLQQSHPLRFAQKLKDYELGAYRFRIGDYRAIFDIDGKGNIQILIILRVGHRKEVYGL